MHVSQYPGPSSAKAGFQQYTQVWQAPCKVTYGSLQKKQISWSFKSFKLGSEICKEMDLFLVFFFKKKTSSLSTMRYSKCSYRITWLYVQGLSFLALNH